MDALTFRSLDEGVSSARPWYFRERAALLAAESPSRTPSVSLEQGLFAVHWRHEVH